MSEKGVEAHQAAFHSLRFIKPHYHKGCGAKPHIQKKIKKNLSGQGFEPLPRQQKNFASRGFELLAWYLVIADQLAPYYYSQPRYHLPRHTWQICFENKTQIFAPTNFKHDDCNL